MSRRSTPERIDQAREAATRNRLLGDGATLATADAWLAAWAEQAARDCIERGKGYWERGWEWITSERQYRAAAVDASPDRAWGNPPVARPCQSGLAYGEEKEDQETA
jgi:hypothetical protein